MLARDVAPETAPAWWIDGGGQEQGGCGLTPVAMSVTTLVLTNRHASRGRFGISDSFQPYIIAVPSCESVDPRFLNVNGGPCQAGFPELV